MLINTMRTKCSAESTAAFAPLAHKYLGTGSLTLSPLGFYRYRFAPLTTQHLSPLERFRLVPEENSSTDIHNLSTTGPAKSPELHDV
jgi:hypothetical protein